MARSSKQQRRYGMTVRDILRVAERFVIANSPGILTGFAVAGTVSTAILTGKAAYSSALQIAAEEAALRKETDPYFPMGTRERVDLVWKNFIPPAVMLTSTIAAIILANHIGTRRSAALAAAFQLSEKMSEEYREKIVKTLGAKTEEKVRGELANDKMSKNPPPSYMITLGSEVLFFDELSGRYFTNQMEAVKKAVNDINHQVNNYYHASLSDFYEMIGLPKTVFSDEIGWNTDELLDVRFSPVMLDDNRPAISISYNRNPVSGFDRCQ
jgi:hypothetical protein